MSKLAATKFVVNFVVGAGVSKVVNEIIVNNTHQPEKVIEKVTMFAGCAVLGMMAKDASKTYVSAKIDSTIESWNKSKQKIAEAKKEES